MRDNQFGSWLGALRMKAKLSQEELAALVGVGSQTISRWEKGLSRPGVKASTGLALALGISVEELLNHVTSDVRISKIVVTGGPCAGKTTAHSWIQNAFTEKGYAVYFISETATDLISGGAAPWLCKSNRQFQSSLVRLQKEKERAFEEIAKQSTSDRVLIVCDRGAMDNRAYMSPLDFRHVLKQLDTNEVKLRDEYDAVFHLVTAAKGAEEFYTLANNVARTESLEQATALDDQLISAWTGHPHLRIIDNRYDFESKMLRLLAEISSFLGEPEPYEIERKYLIEYPDIKRLESLANCKRLDIVQTYLRTERPGEELRIRQRGVDGNFIYFKTHKRPVSHGKRVEVEERLSQQDYLQLMTEADPACRQIQKTRYCLSENGMYYEIDIYPFWRDQAIMEVELYKENQIVEIPDHIRVIREVTGEEAYSNRSLACRI